MLRAVTAMLYRLLQKGERKKEKEKTKLEKRKEKKFAIAQLLYNFATPPLLVRRFLEVQLD